MVVTTVFSSLGTQRAALQTQVDESRMQQARLRDLPHDIKAALQSPSYRSAVLGGLCLWVSFGVNQNLNNYVNTFLWGFTSEHLTIFIFVLMASSVLALIITRPLAQWLAKKAPDYCNGDHCTTDIGRADFSAPRRSAAREW
jgi:Na+/melibiose symporter-like transporter